LLCHKLGICKTVTFKPVGLKSYGQKQSRYLFRQSIDHLISTLKISLKNSTTIYQKLKKLILLGDFNVDYLQRSTAKSRLQTLARAFSFEQLITSATRITQSSKSSIDLIMFIALWQAESFLWISVIIP
jgi:endonuclease/exonuclease/phosphatase family metal-dependent hydrolase